MRISRREAMKIMAAGGAVLGFTDLPSLMAWASKMPDLVVVKGSDPVKNIKAAVEAIGGISRFVPKGSSVVIKPNLGFGNPPERATTTDPSVIRAVAELVLTTEPKRIMVFDYPCHKADIALDICGVKDALKDLDKTFVYTVTRSNLFKEVPIPKGKALKKQKVAKDILEADVIINLPAAKSHGSALVTFGMKNWMGVVEDRRYWHASVDLHQAIADIATLIKPKLTILDATRALVTGGPGGPGKVERLNTIVAGIDPVAVDAYGVTLAKWQDKDYKPEDIPHIKLAAAHGVGTLELDKLEIKKITV